MEAVDVIAQFRSTQAAFATIGALMLTAHLFPPQAHVYDDDTFDFIIVGGGSAGAVVADRLSELPHFSVLLIEAGGDPPIESLTPSLYAYLTRTAYDWNLTSEEEGSAHCVASARFPLTSGRVLGGGSSLNYLLYVRGAPPDYDAWAAAVQDPAWAWPALLPYFLRSESLRSEALLRSPAARYHGTAGFHGVTREFRAEAARYLRAFGELHDVLPDINGVRSLGYTLPLYSVADGVRQTTAYTNLARSGRRPNLRVLKRTLVTEIVFDERGAAVGVRAVGDDHREVTLRARREVVVSAGALNTPKLLMLSGVGPRDHLEALNVTIRSDLPVGRNYNDHILTYFAVAVDDPNDRARPLDPTTQPFPTLAGYVALNRNQSYPDYQTFTQVISRNSTGAYYLCVVSLSQDPEICRHFLTAGEKKTTLFTVVVLLHPKSRGTVSLRSTDPADPPRVCTGTFAHDDDAETLARAGRDHLRVLDTKVFRRMNASLIDLRLRGCGAADASSLEYWRCHVRRARSTMFHYSGTSALGAVLDARLRVHGVRRLRVVDASAMPTLVGGNINAPVMALAEKAADMIKEEYAAPPAPLPAPRPAVSYSFSNIIPW